MRILLQGKDEQRVARIAGDVRAALMDAMRPADLLGPTPAPLAYLDGKHRFHLLAKAETHEGFEPHAKAVREAMKGVRDVTLTLDVDPTETL